MYFAAIMRSLTAVLLVALQVLFCSGYPTTDSGISCALGYYNNVSKNCQLKIHFFIQ